MLNLLWQMGILSAVLVFGVKIGLASKFIGLSKKAATSVAIGYGGMILILTFFIGRYGDTIYKAVYDYYFAIFLVIAIAIILTGIRTIQKWKLHHENADNSIYTSMIVLCPCCIGSIITAIVLAFPVIGLSITFVGQYVAVFLSIIIVTFYFAADRLIRIFNKPYAILLGNLMIFVGLYILASTIIIPNISTVIQSPMSPMTMPSIETLIYTMVFVLILVFMGFFITKNRSSLIQ